LEARTAEEISVIKSIMAEHFFTEKKKKDDHPRDIRDAKKTANLLPASEVGR